MMRAETEHGTSMPATNRSVLASRARTAWSTSQAASRQSIVRVPRPLLRTILNDSWTQFGRTISVIPLIWHPSREVNATAALHCFSTRRQHNGGNRDQPDRGLHPITDTWTQLPNATHAMSATQQRSLTTKSSFMEGMNQAGRPPPTTRPTAMTPSTTIGTSTPPFRLAYDSTIVLANTLVYAGGDSRRLVQHVEHSILGRKRNHVNPTSREGLLTSHSDLQTAPKGRQVCCG